MSDSTDLHNALEDLLVKTIDDRGRNKYSPPGLYAEYGLLLLQSGEKEQARHYFQLEKTTWPESSKFMDHMISETN